MLFVLVLVFLWGYGDLIAGSHTIAARARDQLHKERMMAMEKGLPPPDASFDEALFAYVTDDGSSHLDPAGRRRTTFGWAIALTMGGIGWTAATLAIPQSVSIGWLHDSYSFGIIPRMLGMVLYLHALIHQRS